MSKVSYHELLKLGPLPLVIAGPTTGKSWLVDSFKNDLMTRDTDDAITLLFPLYFEEKVYLLPPSTVLSNGVTAEVFTAQRDAVVGFCTGLLLRQRRPDLVMFTNLFGPAFRRALWVGYLSGADIPFPTDDWSDFRPHLKDLPRIYSETRDLLPEGTEAALLKDATLPLGVWRRNAAAVAHLSSKRGQGIIDLETAERWVAGWSNVPTTVVRKSILLEDDQFLADVLS